MALSALDVHTKQFKLVRNSTGYDMDEVDSFLDEVEAELGRLREELEAAQERLSAAPTMAETVPVTAPETSTTSTAAARILEMAQRTADEYVADARRKADAMVGAAETAARKSVKTLEAQRFDLEARVTALRTFESEIRARLTDYFQSQLADLSALAETGPGPEPGPEPEPE
ncbi:MAG TPA: DivIVA domain-containing protein [Motilibacterales bacterium]|nr:DivIVA domain-containing protein [Motilibacterales bacterium]